MEQVKLPIKTKIAALWIIIIGIITLIILLNPRLVLSMVYRIPFLYFIYSIFSSIVIGSHIIFSIHASTVNLFTFPILIILGIFILFKKKWAWWTILILQVFGLIMIIWKEGAYIANMLQYSAFFDFLTDFMDGIFIYGWQLIFIPPLFLLVPLILLLSDRENFWKIAS